MIVFCKYFKTLYVVLNDETAERNKQDESEATFDDEGKEVKKSKKFVFWSLETNASFLKKKLHVLYDFFFK